MTNSPIREPDHICRDAARKLRAVEVSDYFMAILHCLLDEDWTTPHLVELVITPDGHLLGPCADEVTFKAFLGASEDLIQNIHGVAPVAELDGDEVGYGIGMEPSFAIGQRALLVTHPDGNVLWDCIPLLDDGLVEMIRSIGGISAIAISHPHDYTSMVEWSRAFDCPIYLHAADRQWVMRPDAAIEFWDDETKELGHDLTLLRCGGHFDGGTVLHWPAGAEGEGVILSGDILQVVQDRRWVSFMYSYPNLIPLPASTVRRVVAAVEPFDFDRLYGAWWGKVVATDGKAAVQRSAERYIQAITTSAWLSHRCDE